MNMYEKSGKWMEGMEEKWKALRESSKEQSDETKRQIGVINDPNFQQRL